VKKQVLVINECFSDNLGDQAIARSLNNLLEQQGYKVIQADYTGNTLNSNMVTTSSDRKVNFKTKLISLIKRLEVIRLLAWCLKSYKRVKGFVTKEFDFAVIGGGQLILSNSHFPIALFLWTLLLKWQKKDIYLFAVGSGDSFSPLNNYLIKKSLMRVKSVFVRDKASHEKIKSVFKINSSVIPDVAYSFPLPQGSNKEQTINIVGIVDYAVFKRYANEVDIDIVSENDYMKQWLDKIRKYNLDNILLLATTYTDLELSRKFYEFIQSQNLSITVTFDEKLLSLDDYCSYLSRAENVFSGRMHSLILAERFGCTPIAWPISKKIHAYEAEQKNRESIESANVILKKTMLNITEPYLNGK